MKKAIILMLALSAICSMTACGSENSSSEKEKTTSASAEVVSETDSSSEDSSSTESVVVTKKEEPESSKSDSSEESKDEDEMPDNFLDIIPLADPKNQVSGDGTITDATIADSLEEGIQAFENLDAYSKVVRVDENSTYDSLKAECDDKSLIAVTFDVTEEMKKENNNYHLIFEKNGVNYVLDLGNSKDDRNSVYELICTYFIPGDKNTTVIGEAEFKDNQITIKPYAVNIKEMYTPSGNYISADYLITYTPSFLELYEFEEPYYASYYYKIREELFFVKKTTLA